MSSISSLRRHFWGRENVNLDPARHEGSVLVACDFNSFALGINVLGKLRVHPAAKLEAGLRIGRYANHRLDRIVAQGLEQFADFLCLPVWRSRLPAASLWRSRLSSCWHILTSTLPRKGNLFFSTLETVLQGPGLAPCLSDPLFPLRRAADTAFISGQVRIECPYSPHLPQVHVVFDFAT